MGDALSVTVSIGGLLALSIQICQGLIGYYQYFTGHGEDVAKIARSVENLSRGLQNLDSTLKARRFTVEGGSLVRQVSDSIESSHNVFDELRYENDKFSHEKMKGDISKGRRPFCERTLMHIRACVSVVQDSVSLVIDLQVKTVGELHEGCYTPGHSESQSSLTPGPKMAELP